MDENMNELFEEPEQVTEVPAKPKQKIAWKKVTYYGLLGLFAAVFIVSAAYLLKWFIDTRVNADLYDDLASQVGTQPPQETTQPTEGDSSDPTEESTEPTETKPPVNEDGILLKYENLYYQNTDMVGWIYVADTKINYPVVQSSVDRKDYYLIKNFSKRWNPGGSIYVREVCDVFAPSDNLTIYGHHMKDMSMFAGLDYFWDKAFWETHQTFTFDTIYEEHTYQVFAVFRTSANVGEGFAYHLFVDAANEADFDNFVTTVKQLSHYDTGITAEYGDKLLCLSTCEYTLNNGRLVVVAKRIS